MMMGPGYGHNIEPYLDYFNRHHDSYELVFIYWKRYDFFNKFKNIQAIKLEKKNIFKILKEIRSKDLSLIWQHGNNILLYRLINIFKKKSAIHFLNIWSDRLYLEVKNSLIKRFIARIMLKKAWIHCYWFTTTNNLKSQIKSAFYTTIDCGLHKDIFIKENEKNIVSEHAKVLLSSVVSLRGKKFFYPKSMTDAAGHFLILEAMLKLKTAGFNDFTVIFRRGNEVNQKIEEAIKQFALIHQLQEHLVIQEYSYLSFCELALLWEQMDCGLQIAYHDQLSTTFLEPMLFKKELIATDIESYRIYKEVFGVEIELCEIESESIFKRMAMVCANTTTNDNALEQRKKIIEEHFNFEHNVGKIIDHYIAKV